MSGSVTVSVDGFAEQIASMTRDVVEQDHEAVKANVRAACRTCKSEAAAGSPKRTGRYARGWRYHVDDEGYRVVGHVYNATDWQLTHLLEKGHEQFFMGHDLGYRTAGRKHIEPAYEAGAREMLP